MAKNSVEDKGIERWKELMKTKRTPVVSQCIGDEKNSCGRIDEDNFCLAYINPSTRWRLGNCPLATHIITRIDDQKGKTRVGQQKQKRKKR